MVSVRDIDASARLLVDVGGWKTTATGRVSRAELTYWKLPASATGVFKRVCAPDSAVGCVRFVRFAGVAQRPIRLAARPWDTGGIFSLMIRTNDARAVFDRAVGLGWWAETEPYRFSFGGSALTNVVLTGPDGINFALYERASPPFTDYRLGSMARVFNSMRMVRDKRAAVAFYRDTLGFSAAFDTGYIDPGPGPNNFSIPHNLADKIPRSAAALHPVALGWGRVEVMQFVGLTGKDVSAHAVAPNLGILSVRYPVTGLAAYRTRVETRGAPVVQAGGGVAIGGLGRVNLFAVRDPDGSLTEFYEVVR